ncbi:MAG: DMT family transporter [Porphyromonadaceae bacterium]|nr:DMT family transporter [Porphyromonadaceae bacterium]
MQINTQNKAILATLLGVSIIGLSYVFIKIGLYTSTPLDLLADRLLVAFGGMLLLRWGGLVAVERVSRQDRWRLLLFSLLFPTGFFALQALGLELIPASEAAIIYALLPAFTLAGSRLILGERTRRHQRVGSYLAVAGVLYITAQSLQQLSFNVWGYLFIFASLIAIVFYFICLKSITRSTPITTITYYILLYSSLTVNAFRLISHTATDGWEVYWEQLTLSYWGAILYLGLLCTLCTSFLTNYGIKHLPTNLLGVFNNLSPIIGLFAGVLILGEELHTYYLYGGLVVLLGLVLSSYSRAEEKP